MTRRFQGMVSVIVLGLMLAVSLGLLLPGAKQAWAQSGDSPAEAGTAAPTLPTPPADAPAIEGAPDLAAAEEKFIRADWALLAFEDKKVGYVSKEIMELHADGKLVGHRLIINKFQKLEMSEERPTYHQKSVLNLDPSWIAVSFSTEISRGLDVTTVTGHVADGKLLVTTVAGADTRTHTAAVKSPPTFAGAFIQAMAARGLKPGDTFSVTTIDEQWGAYNETPRQARVMRHSQVPAAGGSGSADVLMIAERTGIFETMHWVHPNGRIYRSEGGVHHLSVRESSMHESRGLKLEGTVEFQNRIPIQSGRTLDSDVCGYQMTVPPYPYLPLVFRDGMVVIISNQLASDRIMMTVTRAASGGADSQRMLFQSFSRLMGSPSEVKESAATVGDLPALRFQGKLSVSGREGWFNTVVTSRGEYYYIFSQVGVWPATQDKAGSIFDALIASVRWKKIFGRERGHWDGQVYISESNNYRLRMLDDGWKIPEDRSGVPTSVEAVRDDRSALLAVEALELNAGTTLAQATASYLERLRKTMPKVENLKQEPRKIGGGDVAPGQGAEALMITYEANAIDDEPTVSRHLLTVHGNNLLVLTLVTKKSADEVNTKHYEKAVESLRLNSGAQ